MAERTSSAGRTEVGKVRRRNEDAILVRGDIGLWLVADGLGGHSAGDYASGLIVERVKALARAGDLQAFAATVEASLSEVNHDLRAEARARGVRLIASTVVLLIDGPEALRCGWVGDSRCYSLADNELRQLTQDHAAGGDGSAGSAPLTRAVGAEAALAVQWLELPRVAGMKFLLCSDGINKELSDKELQQALAAPASPEAITDQLIEAALRRGGRDNVSAVVVAVEP